MHNLDSEHIGVQMICKTSILSSEHLGSKIVFILEREMRITISVLLRFFAWSDGKGTIILYSLGIICAPYESSFVLFK